MLSHLAEVLGIPDAENWVAEITDWGERVQLYRDYTEGKHRVVLTERQRGNLKVHEPFSVDYTDTIVRSMSERLVVEEIVDTDGAETEWLEALLERSDFDILQMQLHNAAVRDGDAYVTITRNVLPEPAAEPELRLAVDFAWNGRVGIIPIRYDSNGMLLEAVKVFEYQGERYAWHYGENLITKYLVVEEALETTEDGVEAWESSMLPIVPFSNRREPGYEMGVSEIAKVLPSQDSLNMTMLDMLMDSRMTAFRLYFAKGFEVDAAALAPGMIIEVSESNPDKLSNIDFSVVSGATSYNYIDQLDRIVDFMADVSNTPLQSKWGANESGEARRQRESGLLAKIDAAQVYFGNSWELVAVAAAQIARDFGRTGDMPRFTVIWEEPEVRSDQAIIEQAVMVYNVTRSLELFLNMINRTLGWDKEEVEKFIKELDNSNNPVYDDNSEGGLEDDRAGEGV